MREEKKKERTVFHYLQHERPNTPVVVAAIVLIRAVVIPAGDLDSGACVCCRKTSAHPSVEDKKKKTIKRTTSKTSGGGRGRGHIDV